MTAPESLSTRRALLLLGVVNSLLALANLSPLIFGGGLTTTLQRSFALVATIGYVGLAIVALAGVLALAIRGERSRKIVRWVAPIAFTLAQTVVFLDVRIFQMFRFHFNGVVWHTLTAPGGWNSLKIPIWDLLALFLLVVLLAAAQRGLLRVFERFGSRPGLSLFTWKRVFTAIALCAIGERGVFAAFDLMRDYEIARAAKVVPGYQRFTIRHFCETWFGYEPGVADVTLTRKKGDTGLRYPVQPLVFEEPTRKPNILWVILESWRHDAFSPEHTPEIWEISRKSHVFQKHVSGGNNTTFGVFSMFYGLYGSYRLAFLNEQRGPLLVQRMKELDYRFQILASFPMTWPEFRKYAFVDVVDHVRDRWESDISAVNDPIIVDEMLKFIDAGPKDQPFFGFLLFDSTHAPYTFPPEFGKFKPYTQDAKFVRYIDVTQRAPEMRNRYFNAALWESYQVGRLWNELEKRGLLENTIVMITGDHGEEFNEHGFWTHSGGFTPEQVRVPMILWWPGLQPRVVTKRTGHQNVAATFMEALGVKNPYTDYSLGRSLFDPHEDRYVVSCGWRDCAVVDDEGYVIFGTEGQNLMNFDVLDHDYKEVPDPRAAIGSRGDRMMNVMQEMGIFLR